MNKKQIDEFVPKAFKALEGFGIAKNGKIDTTFRNYISSFGASIVMGSLVSAVAFNSNDGKSKGRTKHDGESKGRTKLMKAVYSLVADDTDYNNISDKKLLEYVVDNNNNATKEKIVNAAIAIKLAMNMYVLVDKKNSEKKQKDAENTGEKENS